MKMFIGFDDLDALYGQGMVFIAKKGYRWYRADVRGRIRGTMKREFEWVEIKKPSQINLTPIKNIPFTQPDPLFRKLNKKERQQKYETSNQKT